MSKRKIEEQRIKGDGKLVEEEGKREKREMGDERERRGATREIREKEQ